MFTMVSTRPLERLQGNEHKYKQTVTGVKVISVHSGICRAAVLLWE